MTLERRRPLPPGRYWADVVERNRIAFEAWARVNAASVSVEATEHAEPSDGAPARDWVLFVTTAELVWPDAILGFAPNIAEPAVHSSSDVIQRPPPPVDMTTSLTEAMKSVIYAVGALAVVGTLLVLVSATRKVRR
jgi:hypothetical protein